MKRLIFACIMAFLFFVILWFVYCNLGAETFSYGVSFKFDIPIINVKLQSLAIPMGFVIVIAFCLGMVAIALLEALPSLYKTLEIRSKNKKIRQLERELTLVRQMNKDDEDVVEESDEEENKV